MRCWSTIVLATQPSKFAPMSITEMSLNRKTHVSCLPNGSPHTSYATGQWAREKPCLGRLPRIAPN